MVEDLVKNRAALFDLDGVVLDTESQYSDFWSGIGREFHPDVPQFSQLIKGQTLVQIYDKWFVHDKGLQQHITERLNLFELNMNYPYIVGAENFICQLKEAGFGLAVVTSSNNIKMTRVYESHPELKQYFDQILTSEHFTRSKPDPMCYQLAADMLSTEIKSCVVFEDSFHGIEAGRRAGMKVVGLSTTNLAKDIKSLCSCVINDFTEISVEKILQMLG